MTRFDLYANRNAAERRTLPCYVDVQAESLRHLATRVVLPVFELQGKRLVPATTDVVGSEARFLGARAGSLAEHGVEMVAAIDDLPAGV